MPWKPGGKVQQTIFCGKLYENLALTLKVLKKHAYGFPISCA